MIDQTKRRNHHMRRQTLLRVELLEPRLTLTAIAPPSGLVAWWAGDGDAKDYAGTNDGILEGGTTFAPGMVGQAFSLDGIDDRIRVPTNASLNPADGITVEAWVKSDDINGPHVIFSKWGQLSDSYIFKDHNNSDKLRIELSQSGSGVDLADLQGTTSIVPGQWTHVAFTYDSSTVRLYFNGVKDSELVIGPNRFISQSISDLVIGAFQIAPGISSENFRGLIDEVSLYNRALSDTEIQSIALAGSAGKEKPIVAPAEYGTQRFDGWAQKIFPDVPAGGSPDLMFQTSNDSQSLFSTQPAIDSTGRLTYTPARNSQGTAIVTVVKKDGSSGNEETAVFVIQIIQRAPWQNDFEGEDVDDDGYIIPEDALLVIDRINGVGSGEIPNTDSKGPFYDADGDNNVAPSDVLRIINWLNANDWDAEGEFGSVGAGAGGVVTAGWKPALRDTQQELDWLTCLSLDVAGQPRRGRGC